ncbi:TonB-dependent receptor [Erythrobacter litoralis HTCC2594]|uniref:TonB-dependent receptor n=1 Tax=Erythrobacter litoralis (strain HTCC2594) TaxID=314225 RepID=Q2NBV2_ERYLH|nr:TonB-dependent receptor [Erythrobacter litoralis HTCC2594]
MVTGDPPPDDDIIVVTATRRAEDVQDIPLAVTAVSPAQLERQGVVNVQDITSVSPSFSTSNAQLASGSVVLRIRGVGTTSNNIGFESAVGIFIDGAYQSRPGVALSEFVDVERVEVLRGPQGTLFGRNTSAGALNITNRRPDLSEFGGFANATYGNRDLISVQGAVNVPVCRTRSLSASRAPIASATATTRWSTAPVRRSANPMRRISSSCAARSAGKPKVASLAASSPITAKATRRSAPRSKCCDPRLNRLALSRLSVLARVAAWRHQTLPHSRAIAPGWTTPSTTGSRRSISSRSPRSKTGASPAKSKSRSGVQQT